MAALKGILKFIFIALAISSVQAKDWSQVDCNVDLTNYANEAVKLSLSGIMLSGESSCLNQKSFNYLTSEAQPPMDSKVLPEILLSPKTNIKIVSIKDDGVGVVDVSFIISDQGKIYREKIKFIRRGKATSKMNRPCGFLYEGTRKKYLYKSCQK